MSSKPFGTPAQDLLDSGQIKEKRKTMKEIWDNQYGEGTRFDLDYGKLIILALCVYIAIKVS
tara:strand:+ start:44 stop:229 length:186 start_codon:yes stop_codon:yes gene_type:complete